MFRSSTPFTVIIFALAAAVRPAAADDETSPPKVECVQTPGSPAGRRFAQWFDAFNKADAEALGQFNEKHLAESIRSQNAAAKRTEMELNIARQTGGFALDSIRSVSDYELEAIMRARKAPFWGRLNFAVEKAEPHGVTLNRLRPTANPNAADAPRLSDAEIVAQLKGELDKRAADDRFSGVVLLLKDGQTLFSQACGMADRADERPNQMDTKFSLASMGKMFTGVAVAQLAAQGKLDFDDTIGEHLTDYPNKAVAERVTIHQLLTHTSGLGSYWNERFEARRFRIRSVRDWLPTFVDDAPEFEPGKRWSYSNAGFIVLGAVIEKASGQDYYSYLREHIFLPAEMTDTDYYEVDQIVPKRAVGYTHRGPGDEILPGPWRSNMGRESGRGGPAGGAWSTAPDLAKFVQALCSHRLLDAAMTERVTGPQVSAGEGPDRSYGYGFMAERVNGHRVWGHGGGFPGVSTQLDVFADLGYTVVILSNIDDGAPPLVMQLREWLTQGRKP